jgi:hypothetical protein
MPLGHYQCNTTWNLGENAALHNPLFSDHKIALRVIGIQEAGFLNSIGTILAPYWSA